MKPERGKRRGGADGLPAAVYGKERKPMSRHGGGGPVSRRNGIFLLLTILLAALLLIALVMIPDCFQG